MEWPTLEDFHLGGIVGLADLVDVVDQCPPGQEEWWSGPFGWVLENVRTLPFFKMPGKLGLFDVPVTRTYIAQGQKSDFDQYLEAI